MAYQRRSAQRPLGVDTVAVESELEAFNIASPSGSHEWVRSTDFVTLSHRTMVPLLRIATTKEANTFVPAEMPVIAP